MSKGEIFSDTRSRRAGADDALTNQGVEGLESVQTRQVGDGLMMDCNCVYCGKQVISIAKWVELVHWVRGIKTEDTFATTAGIVYQCSCGKCATRTKVLINWNEIRDTLTAGVHARKVHPGVLPLLAGVQR